MRKPPPADVLELHLRNFADPVVIDGEYHDKMIWAASVKTPIFMTAEGKGMVPYSDARFVWGRGFLYVLFYAGDLDIQAKQKKRRSDLSKDDHLHIEVFSETYDYVIDISPLKTISDKRCKRRAGDAGSDPCEPWDSQLTVGVDMDGTPNKLGEWDEEWVLEMSIPLRALGIEDNPGSRISLGLRRCEINNVGLQQCGTWGTAAKHATLILEGPPSGR